jgi:hypothetical protein
MPYCKIKAKEYRQKIPIEKRRLYEKRYLMTEKWQKCKREKNRRYREKKKLQLQNISV